MNDRLLSLCYNYRWFDCFRLSPEVLNRYHIEMTKYQPECIVAYASALAAFAQFLRENGLKPTYPCKCIVTGAEKLFDAQRELAESVFGKPIYERYGARDAGSMGFQLDVPQSKNLTIDWPNVFIEPETSEPESAILVTKLQADGTLMIRYRIGDLARFPDGSKPGHPVFELLSVVGRATERIWLPAGAFISGNQFPHLFKDFPVREFMVVQQEDFSVQVKILPDDKFSSAAETEILQTIAENLPGLQVKVAVVDAIPRTAANKWRPVVSYVASQKRVESQT
jgi:phenylacetate-CoA ligase